VGESANYKKSAHTSARRCVSVCGIRSTKAKPEALKAFRYSLAMEFNLLNINYMSGDVLACAALQLS
jgi:hypothetical protein